MLLLELNDFWQERKKVTAKEEIAEGVNLSGRVREQT